MRIDFKMIFLAAWGKTGYSKEETFRFKNQPDTNSNKIE